MTEGSILQVFVFRAGAYVGSELFTEPELVVGRGEGADLLLDDDLVANSHAILAHENGQATILDLGPGVRVNGARTRHAVITPRDEIQLGGHTLKIKFVAPRGRSTRPTPALSAPPAPARPPLEAPNKPEAHRVGTALPAADFAADLSADEILTQARSPEDYLASELPVDSVTIRLSGSDVLAVRPLAEGPASSPRRRRREEEDPEIALALDSAFLDEPSDPSHDTAPGAQPRRAAKPAPQPEPLAASRPEPVTAPAQPSAAPPGAQRNVPTARVRQQPSEAPTPAAARPATPRQSEPAPKPVERAPTPAAPAPAAPAPQAAQVTDHVRLTRSPAPSPAAPHAVPPEDEVDEEELDAERAPGFSLLEALLQRPSAPAGGALEVMAFSGSELDQVAVLGVRDKYVLGRRWRGRAIPEGGHPGLRLAKLVAQDRAEILLPGVSEGVLLQGGEQIHLDALKIPANAASKRADLYRHELRPGQSLTLRVGRAGFHVRFVPPAPVTATAHVFSMDRAVARALGSSVAVHLVVGLIVGLTAPAVSFSDLGREHWAELPKDEARDVRIEPPPPPEPPRPPDPEPAVEVPAQPEAAPPREAAPRRSRAAKAPKTEVKSAGVLGAVGKLNLSSPGRRDLTAAVSNLNAVSAPGDSNFRTGGLVGKTPTSDISVGGGGGTGGAPLTRGSAELLRGGDGLGAIGKRTSGQVRGKVAKVSARQVEARGSLSREEIARVIDAHLGEINHCYERALNEDPALRGKLVLEWTIQLNGSVSQVRQKLSSMSNPSVAACIMDRIQKWRFPSPSGGVVVVSYPFVFSATAF